MMKLMSLPALFLFPALGLLGYQELAQQRSARGQAVPDAKGDLVVHEWGTFTTVSGSDGAALEWRPLLGKTSDLPSFVYGTGRRPTGTGLRFDNLCEHDSKGRCNSKKCMRGTVRMETPVLYFYTKHKQRVSVRVDFPGGKITEWYPKAKQVEQGIDWGQIELQPDYRGGFPREAIKNHYYPARETDAVPVQVCSSTKPIKEHEKFLFYRGVGTFPLPLRATLIGSDIRLENRSKSFIPSVLVFDRRTDGIRISIMDRLAPGKPFEIRPTKESSTTEVFQILERLLEKQGLYRKEAKAMVETWKDHWFTPGLRVFYLLPTPATDAILPLTVVPAPKKVVRVLVGRIEILTPQQRARIRALAAKLGDEDFVSREKATKALMRIGRFAAPVLEQILLDSKDLEVRARIEALLTR